jgi:hypothetical protein
VIGHEFTARLVERVSAMERQAAHALGELRAVELIDEKAIYPELVYMFKHALTHDGPTRVCSSSAGAFSIVGPARSSRSCTWTGSRSSTGRYMADRIPGAQFHGFRGRGHLPTTTATAELVGVVRNFVRTGLP